MSQGIIDRLLEEAKSIANSNFCCNHSKYTVGAALLTKEGKVYKGFNVENDGIQSICAERVAFTKAISEGEKEFASVLIIGNDDNCTPCGYCRQFMSEFVDENFKICTVNGNDIKEYNINEILPYRFKL